MRSPRQNPKTRARQGERGSILVVCMVLAGLGTIGVAAWIALLDARGNQVEATVSGIERRVIGRNSRALAFHAVYTNHLHSATPPGGDVTYALPDGLGAATIRAYAGAPLSNSSQIRHTKSGGVPTRSFTTDVTVDAADGVGLTSWELQLRSYNPVLGGDLLTLQPIVNFDEAGPIVRGNFNVKGRAVFWDVISTDFPSSFRADEVHLPNDINGATTFANGAGDPVLPLNYPIPLQTNGVGPGGPMYSGELDITRSSTNTHNDYATRLANTGNLLLVEGSNAAAHGPGPDTLPDRYNDDFLATEVATQSPDYLVAELPNHYPLSSRILNAVSAKSNPPFTEDQLYDIFAANTPIPDDSLTVLTGTYATRIGSRTDDLHRANGTAVSSDGNGTVRVFLEEPTLPHLLLDETSDVRLMGQLSAADAAAASGFAPVAVVVANSPGFGVNRVLCDGRNSRRLVFAISTESISTPPYTYTPDVVFSSATPFPVWHAVIELQNTGARFDTTAVSGATIVGGIRANRPLESAGGTLTLEQEFERNDLEPLLSRNAWIEAYRK